MLNFSIICLHLGHPSLKSKRLSGNRKVYGQKTLCEFPPFAEYILPSLLGFIIRHMSHRMTGKFYRHQSQKFLGLEKLIKNAGLNALNF